VLLNPRVSPVHLRTERLALRLPELADADAMAVLFRDNRAFLQPYYPTFEPSIFTRQGWLERVRALHEEYRMGRSLRLGIFPLDQPNVAFGVANFTMFQRDPLFGCNLGYSLGETFQGNGYMHEALTEAIPYVFENLHIHRIAANYMPTNARSGKVLEKLGFRIEGTARDYLRIDGRWEDHVMTAITNPDWRPSR
jgi:ribosomal-protein-alanine N-acetyltransferase